MAVKIIKEKMIGNVEFVLIEFSHDIHDFTDRAWYTRRDGQLSIVNCATMEFDDVELQKQVYELTGRFHASVRYRFGVKLKYKILSCLHYGCKIEELDYHAIREPARPRNEQIGDHYGARIMIKNANPELIEHDSCDGCAFRLDKGNYCLWGRRINADRSPRANQKCFKVTDMSKYKGADTPGNTDLGYEV